MKQDVSKGCLKALAIALGVLFLALAGFMAVDYYYGDQIGFLREFRQKRKEELKRYLIQAHPPDYDSATIALIVESYSRTADSGALSDDHYWEVMNAVMEAGSDQIIDSLESKVAIELMREVTDTSQYHLYDTSGLPPLSVDSSREIVD